MTRHQQTTRAAILLGVILLPAPVLGSCEQSAARDEPAAAGDRDAGVSIDAARDLPPPLGSPACDAIDLPPPELGLQMQLPVDVPPNSEREFCMLVLVEQDLKVNWNEGVYTDGSHHGLLMRTAYRDEIPTTTIDGAPFEGADRPHPCAGPGSLWDTRGVLPEGTAASLREDPDVTVGGRGVLPPDAAFTIERGEVLLVNYHALNFDDGERQACYKVNLHGIPPADVEHEAGLLFFYNPYITVPPGGQTHVRMACPIDRNIRLLTLRMHMHARGVGADVKLWSGDPTLPGSSPELLHSETSWDEPRERRFDDGGMHVEAGQWLEWSCDYENPEDRAVSQGVTSTDEMCVLSGLYYPRDRELEDCGRYGFLDAVMWGEGDGDGLDFLSCLSDKAGIKLSGDDPERYDLQACFTQTCPEASAPLNPFLRCLSENEPADCAEEQAAVVAATCD